MAKKTIVERENQGVDSYTVTHEGKDYNYKVQKPTFEQISAGLSESMAMSGKLNMAGGGNVIWQLCVGEYDEEIVEAPTLLMAVCIDLYNTYVLPAEVTIKKN